MENSKCDDPKGGSGANLITGVVGTGSVIHGQIQVNVAIYIIRLGTEGI